MQQSLAIVACRGCKPILKAPLALSSRNQDDTSPRNRLGSLAMLAACAAPRRGSSGWPPIGALARPRNRHRGPFAVRQLASAKCRYGSTTSYRACASHGQERKCNITPKSVGLSPTSRCSDCKKGSLLLLRVLAARSGPSGANVPMRSPPHSVYPEIRGLPWGKHQQQTVDRNRLKIHPHDFILEQGDFPRKTGRRLSTSRAIAMRH